MADYCENASGSPTGIGPATPSHFLTKSGMLATRTNERRTEPPFWSRI